MITLKMSREQLTEIVDLLREFRAKPTKDLATFRLAVDPAVLDLLVHLSGKLATES